MPDWRLYPLGLAEWMGEVSVREEFYIYVSIHTRMELKGPPDAQPRTMVWTGYTADVRGEGGGGGGGDIGRTG